jgi:hypothetical protein
MARNMFIADEVRHLLAGTHREQRASLNLLKFMTKAEPSHSRKRARRGGEVAYDGDRCSPTVFAPLVFQQHGKGSTLARAQGASKEYEHSAEQSSSGDRACIRSSLSVSRRRVLGVFGGSSLRRKHAST